MLNMSRYALLAFQFIGLLASVFLVSVTFLNSEQVEQRLQSFAIGKVEVAADAAWRAASDKVGTGGRAERFGALAKRFGIEAEALDQKRADVVPALVAFALSDRCGAKCGFPALAGLALNSVLLEQAAELRVGQATLGDFIVERYETTLRGLVLDLRRFGIVNAVTLFLMGALIIFKDMLNWRFAAFSIAVTGYATWAAYGYVYQQDWARAVLLQNWASSGYQVGMIFACCLFFDWLFLNGKITELVVNAISAALSAFSV